MDGYREFWNTLIYGNQYLGPQSLERYWITIGICAALAFLLGIASIRLRIIAPVATVVIFLAYVTAVVPFMVWAASCTGCGASISYDTARSGELIMLHLYWSGVFTTAIAALWLGVLLSQGVKAIMARQTPPPSSPAS